MANFLIVEDDPVVRKILDTALQNHGHSCVQVKDGFEALDRIHQELFDMIICDINLPVHNGFVAIEAIRKDPKFATIPVLFLSGRRDKRDVEKALEVGGDDYLVKPIDFDLLFAKIDTLLQKKTQSHSFTETEVEENAYWKVELKVTGLSEQGLTFKSKFPFPLNFKLKIESQIFAKIGIEAPKMRVAVCTQEKDQFVIKTSFIGMSAAELQDIRKWSKSNNIIKRTG